MAQVMIITSDSYTRSPELPPFVGDDVHAPEAGVDEHVEHILGVSSLLEALAPVHRFDLVELALHEDFSGLASLPDRDERFVDLLGPVEVGLQEILVLIERPAHHQYLEEPQEQLLSLCL